MVQAITLALSIVIKNIKVAEIKTALFNKDPIAMLEDSGLVNTPVMTPE